MYVSIATGLLEPCWCKISIRKVRKREREHGSDDGLK
jgi:hypothetical protein